VDAFLANVRTLVDLAALVEERVAERDLIELLSAFSALGLFNVLGIRNEKLRASIDGH
jgi:hypothetical protein